MSTHDTHTQYKLRMPPDLRDRLKQAAEGNHRSMNAEIVARLEESLVKTAPSNGEDPAAKEDFSAEDVLLMYRELDTAVKNIQKLRASREKFLNRHDPENEKADGPSKVDVDDDLLK